MEKSCGIVLFHSDEFLVIQHSTESNEVQGHWDFPKGHVEDNESELETATRELQEETGIDDFRLINNFRQKITYKVHKNNTAIPKEVIFFLAESSTKSVQLSSEHQNYRWLDFDLAHDRLTYSNAKEVLVKAKTFLEK
ncbi:MAG: bis(5'-nucleosyl)-tetraphosphatase [Candidatus Thermoplasmatota archaeon]|nr:bis(5'-nucleosyl)-tetraphosphatase [Candidatus Thermoplasmatota archaeon]